MEPLSNELGEFTRRGTPAERRIARYFLENFDQLRFETAASIADRLDLSPMTVGRFLRALGVQAPDELHLRVEAPAVVPVLDAGRPLSSTMMPALLGAQAEALTAVHRVAGEASFAPVVRRIDAAQTVIIAAYQGLDGIVRHFTDQLSQARDRVVHLDGQRSACLELLTVPCDNSLLILIDYGRLSTRVRGLAAMARSAGHQVVLITDQPSGGHGDGVDWILALPRARPGALTGTTALVALLELLVASVIVERGDAISERSRRMGELREVFVDFSRQ